MREMGPINRVQMKTEARLAMREHRPSVYLVTLVYLVLGYILSVLSIRLAYPNLDMNALMLRAEDPESMLQSMTAMVNSDTGLVGHLLNLAVELMTVMLEAGFVSFCLAVIRKMPAGYERLFDAFGLFLKVLWLTILRSLIVALWSLLLVVPGVIAAYRYSQALYILLDAPDKSALTCLRESKEMTMGHKAELFFLDLSFLGWYLLASFLLVSIFVSPYVGLTKANYYLALSGRQEEPKHVDFSF